MGRVKGHSGITNLLRQFHTWIHLRWRDIFQLFSRETSCVICGETTASTSQGSYLRSIFGKNLFSFAVDFYLCVLSNRHITLGVTVTVTICCNWAIVSINYLFKLANIIIRRSIVLHRQCVTKAQNVKGGELPKSLTFQAKPFINFTLDTKGFRSKR